MSSELHLPASPGMIYSCHGVRFRIAVDCLELWNRLPAVLPFGTEILPARHHDHVQLALRFPAAVAGAEHSRGTGSASASDQLDRVLAEFGRDLMIHVANLAEHRVFVHAGVVGWRGRAIVLPGTSFAGKTTLVAALVRAGATYYSDEYALVDQEGWIHPYARDLQMRQPGTAEQSGMPVSSLNGTAGSEPLRTARVVFSRYENGAVCRLAPLSAGMAVLEMLRHSIPVRRTPGRVMASLTAMMSGATAWRTLRGEAREAADFLLREMDACEPSGTGSTESELDRQ